MQDPRPRISRIDWNGTPAWLKRCETLSLRYRLQKGDPRKSFETEKAIYAKLAQLDLPGPEVLEESADHIVIKDAGPTLDDVLKAPEPDTDAIRAALMLAVTALAKIHSAGVVHGRPAPRDICIQDGQVTLLDWERYSERRNTPKGSANDFVTFVFFTIVSARGVPDGLLPACQSYLRAVPPTIFPQIRKRVRTLSRLQKLLTPLIRKYDHKADIAGIAPTLTFLRDEICGLDVNTLPPNQRAT